MRLVVVLALTALIAGCGGSDARFGDRANATCADANERVRALGPEPRTLTAEQARASSAASRGPP